MSAKSAIFVLDASRAKLICALLGAAFLAHAAWYNFMSDDGFIVLRYASNLVHGEGLVFNPGDRVEGFSSWSWVLLIAGGQSLGCDPVVFARVAGVGAGLLTIAVSLLLGFSLTPAGASSGWALWGPLVVAANAPFACWAPAGLETALYGCLLTATAWAATTERTRALAALSTLCLLTRPEAVLLIVVLAVLRGRVRDDTWRSTLRVWIFPAAALLGQSVCRWLYYGDLLPNTFYAKTGGSWAQWARGFHYLLDYAGDHEGLPLMVVPVVVGLAAADRRLRMVAGLVVATWASIVWEGGDGLPMYRFMVPVVPLAAVLLGAVTARGYQIVMAYLGPAAVAPRVAVMTLLAAVACVHARAPGMDAHYGNYEYQEEVEVPRWARVGLWLRNEARPEDSFASVPIGAVAYYSGLRTYDMVGLTDRHIAHRQMPAMGHGIAGHEKHDGAYIVSQRPTYLLLGNIDVTPRPRDPAVRPFIPHGAWPIADRETDVFDADGFEELYEPRSVRIGPTEYLNFYQLRDEFRRR